ncbi:hypothetical protein [Sulfurovum sp.]|uniref:Hpt domain-containing protein n=1 Tax=Sulfurovum sp. TaxID=1969726 RepID=UPI0025FD1E49|nr:hypothetical protein [Sulfurovum sp.]
MLFTWFIIFVLVIVLGILVYKGLKKEKTHQEERGQQYQKEEEPASPVIPPVQETITPEVQSQQPEVIQEIPDTIVSETETAQQIEKKTEAVVIPPEAPKEAIALPKASYPKFDHSRLIDMGLSQEEAKEFIQELITQIKTQIPLIKEAMYDLDFHTMERLTHSIKGSATNIGTGGVSDLLVDYNTYLKTGKEIAIIQRYLMYLQYQLKELEKQYSA